jgi:hypothetical protein
MPGMREAHEAKQAPCNKNKTPTASLKPLFVPCNDKIRLFIFLIFAEHSNYCTYGNNVLYRKQTPQNGKTIIMCAMKAYEQHPGTIDVYPIHKANTKIFTTPNGFY